MGLDQSITIASQPCKDLSGVKPRILIIEACIPRLVVPVSSGCGWVTLSNNGREHCTPSPTSSSKRKVIWPPTLATQEAFLLCDEV
ncbi:hypothetical protein V2G26_017057 [Clonostachys chloroleuca]